MASTSMAKNQHCENVNGHFVFEYLVKALCVEVKTHLEGEIMKCLRILIHAIY